MKYKIDDLMLSDTKEINVSQFFPTATEPVIITIRHLMNKNHNDIIALMMIGQKIAPANEKGEFEIKDTGWYQRTRDIYLLDGVVINDNFPFEKWDKATIDGIDKRCPEFIQFLQDEIQEFNRPLAIMNEKD